MSHAQYAPNGLPTLPPGRTVTSPLALDGVSAGQWTAAGRRGSIDLTGNRGDDSDKHSPDILKLRELHAAMDRAVLDAYGWPDKVHDEVLARLLDLNQKRYDEEVAAGLHDKGGKKPAPPKKTKPKAALASNATLPLFGDLNTAGERS